MLLGTLTVAQFGGQSNMEQEFKMVTTPFDLRIKFRRIFLAEYNPSDGEIILTWLFRAALLMRMRKTNTQQ